MNALNHHMWAVTKWEWRSAFKHLNTWAPKHMWAIKKWLQTVKECESVKDQLGREVFCFKPQALLRVCRESQA